MTANKRIFLNIIATYGRSLFTLGCGLISGRWVLAILGEVNFGLWGLIGGMTVFISFFIVMESVMLPSLWFIAFTKEDREFVGAKFAKLKARLCHG